MNETAAYNESEDRLLDTYHQSFLTEDTFPLHRFDDDGNPNHLEVVA